MKRISPSTSHRTVPDSLPSHSFSSQHLFKLVRNVTFLSINVRIFVNLFLRPLWAMCRPFGGHLPVSCISFWPIVTTVYSDIPLLAKIQTSRTWCYSVSVPKWQNCTFPLFPQLEQQQPVQKPCPDGFTYLHFRLVADSESERQYAFRLGTSCSPWSENKVKIIKGSVFIIASPCSGFAINYPCLVFIQSQITFFKTFCQYILKKRDCFSVLQWQMISSA